MFRFSVTYPQRCYLDSSYSLQILFPPFYQFPTLRGRSVHSNSQLTLYLAGGDRGQTADLPDPWDIDSTWNSKPCWWDKPGNVPL